jgi:stearoyl-CoA desaturase (delta-9 desaturase)
LPRLIEYAIVLLGLPAGTPIQWVGNHRAHHLNTDQDGDPHSPHIDGFWYSHCGWYIHSKNWFLCLLYALAGPLRMLIDSVMRPNTNQEHIQLAKDIQKDKFYAFVSRPIIYMLIMWIYLAVILIIPFLLFGWLGMVASSITLVIIYNLGDAVDSIGHLFGKKRGENEARNNVFLGIFAFGDGWHANHHLRPRRAKHGIKNNQIDLSYLVLRLGKLVGVVKKIH